MNALEKLEAYAKEVRKMRAAQKSYFNRKTGFLFNEAKRAEKRVDTLTRRLLEPNAPTGQNDLFEESYR